MKFSTSAACLLVAASAASAAKVPVHQDTCSVLQKNGLINLDVLGCSNITLSVLDAKAAPSKKASTCKALQEGGLINLNLLGCSNVNVDVLGGLLHLGLGVSKRGAPKVPPTCSAADTCSIFQKGFLNLDLLGCLNLNLDILKRGAAHHTSTTTKKTTTTKPTATKTTTTAKPTSTPTKPCNADTCSILQKGGLLNLDLLGCSNVNVDIL
ncbi:hypothetical protein OC846_006275 [Tilletia horrida]|uniref:Hydrophobin n=1 Tax=Tilletia horrida TaxID=155126 RepID=A0AAN6GJS5_9BASI|nr:hypothetical protein OC846_006275 [Tilletia horrida]KAK0561481.1 hypothetical protein OC861_005801 [Tilletia horrida]